MKLVKLDGKLFEVTKSSWNDELNFCEEHFSTMGYQYALDAIELKLQNPAPSMHYFALLEDDSSEAVALVTCSHALPGSPDGWLKVLEIRMTPKVDSRNPRNAETLEFQRYEEVTKYAGEIVANLLEFSKECKCHKLKVYTNMQTDVAALKAVAHNLKSSEMFKDLGILVDSHKNWLEFTF